MLLSCDQWLKFKRGDRGDHTKATEQAWSECQVIISAKVLGLALEMKVRIFLT